MEKLDGRSKDIEQTEREKLASVFPQCFVEGKLDIDKLLSLCGEYILKDFEKYEFTWKGKSECLPLAQQRSTATLRPCPEESVNFETTQNLYIEGDNLEVLKLLQTAYYRRIKMIYIDPPYNTGNDFVYEDDFKDPLQRYREVTSQTTKSNPEAMGRFHTNWLNMMYPRLRLAANLLRDDGVIFISIDDHEQANLRKICDEIFGEENFISNIIWQKKYTRSNDAIFFSDNNGIAWSPPIGTFRRFNDKSMKEMDDNNEIWFGIDGTQTPSRKSFLCDVKDGITPVTIWQYDEVGHNHEANNELKHLEIAGVFNNPKPTRLLKRILILSTKIDDIILDFFSGSATTAHAVMQLNAEDGGNRQFIMVQLPELCPESSEAFKAGYKNICEIGKERIRRAGAKILEKAASAKRSEKQMPEHKDQLSLVPEKDASPHAQLPDTGFKVFRLDSSNLKIWDSTPFPEDDLLSVSNRLHSMIDRVKSDRTDLDVVYEIMLKLGVPLTYNVSPVDISGKTAWSVGDFLLLICLSDGLTVEMIEEMAGYAPGQIILAEHSLPDDSAMSNAHYILRDRNIALKLV